MTFFQRLVVVCSLFSVVGSLQWAASPRDEEVLYACVGNDVTIPWAFNLTAGEEITSIEWLFRGASQEMMAIFSHGAFVPLPAFSNRIERVSTGGLILRHVTKGDAGRITIEINGNNDAVDLFASRSVRLQINDGLQTRDGELHVTEQPGAIVDPVSQEWSVVLSCGQFTYADQPAFPMEWMVSQPTAHIAFNVRSTGNQQLSRPSHVIFNDILYNQGDAYSSSTGVFTVPVSGTYVFYVHTQSYSSYYASFYIMANDREICLATLATGDDHGSCQTVAHLTARDRVWVEPFGDNQFFNANTTSFTGFLLYADPR